ncbi:MAG: flagellar FliJ family protein [Planctomycetota bacterium]
MARFRFRLQPVLRQRELAEQDVRVKVADVEQVRIELEDRLRKQQQRIEHEEETLNAMTSGRHVAAETLRLQGVAAAAARAEAQRLAVELAGVLKRLEAARSKLAERAAERRSIELLRDRQAAAFRREQDRIETATLDDLAAAAAARTHDE